MPRTRDDDETTDDPRLKNYTPPEWQQARDEATCFPLCQHARHIFTKGFDPYPKVAKPAPKRNNI